MIGLTSGARATVTVTLEIAISDNWGAGATVEQIHRQAVDSALQRLNSTIGGHGKIVGQPVVTAILFEVKA